MEILIFKKSKNERPMFTKLSVKIFISVMTPLAAQKCDSNRIQSEISWNDMAFEFKYERDEFVHII